MFPKVIGISGLAGSGKDKFFELLKAELPHCQRFALADALKLELNDTFKKLYNVDVFTCSREMKDIIRPMMVAHGKVRRTMTQGQYWTSLLKKQIDDFFIANPSSIICVTDIRYDVYPEDECYWLKEKMKGKLVHVSTYKEVNGERIFSKPPNEEEAFNDPKLQLKADYKVVWPRLITPSNPTPDWTKLKTYVTECLEVIGR